MAAIHFLRKQWKEEALYRPFHPYLHIDDDGLSLGATRLAPMITDRTGATALVIDGEGERILALLSLAYRKRISIEALKFIKRASTQWMHGEKALAHFELAYAQLPRFETTEEAKLLFYADGLVNYGVSARALMRSHDLDPRNLDLLRYSADQPRVPSGNGRESGEWTSGDGGQQYAQNRPRSPFLPFQTLPVGGSDGEGGGWRGDPGEGTKAGEAEGVTSTIEIPSGRFGQAAEHAQDAINSGQPDTLTIDRAGAAENRLAATGGLEKVPGMHLDEYLPAMFKEGGAGASVRAISPHDNMSLGAYIGVCCRRLPDGARIKIRIGE